MLNLYIWYDRLEYWRIVHHVLPTVYESFVIEIDEYFLDELIILVIKSKPLHIPVHGCTHHLDLILYISSVFIDPLPALSEKCFSSDSFSACSIAFQSLLHLSLCRYPSMICPGYPKCRIPTESMIASHDILDRERQSVSEMEITGHIRRWNRNVESLLFGVFGIYIWQIYLFLFPECLTRFLVDLWIVLFWKIRHSN